MNLHKDNKKDNSTSFALELVETLITSFVVLMVIYWGVALPEIVLGASMEPTIHGGERILVERVTKHFKNYERGDIVVLHPPQNDNIDYVKRIVGIPGDVVKILDCDVYISRNGEKFKLEEPYLQEETCTTDGPKLKEGRSLELQDNEYLVFGDNRGNSADSRLFGVLKKDRILGRVVLRFWPFDEVKIF